MDEFESGLQRLTQTTRFVRLLNFKLLQLRHTHEQLLAAQEELVGRAQCIATAARRAQDGKAPLPHRKDPHADGGIESIGLLVDGVSEVLRVSAADVEAPSATTIGNGPHAVLGVAKLGKRLVLLDLDAALGGAPIEFQTQPQLPAPGT